MDWATFVVVITRILPMMVLLIILLKVIKIFHDFIYKHNLNPEILIPAIPYVAVIYYVMWFIMEYSNPANWGLTKVDGSWTVTFDSVGGMSSNLSLLIDKMFGEGLVVILSLVFLTGFLQVIMYNIKLFKNQKQKKNLPELRKR